MAYVAVVKQRRIGDGGRMRGEFTLSINEEGITSFRNLMGGGREESF